MLFVPALFKPRLRNAVLCSALSVALSTSFMLPAPVVAAVLGEVKVRSYLGQKLDADIEISALTATESEALLVRIPAADAFAAAGLDMTAVVRSLRVTIEKRGEQTFVRLNSDQSIAEPFLMLLVELNAGGTRTLRQYALLIDPAPLDRLQQAGKVEPPIAEPQTQDSKGAAPADARAPSATANAAGSPDTAATAANAANAATAATAATAGTAAPSTNAASSNARLIATTSRRVRKGDTLAAIGNELKPEGIRLEQVLVALQRANPQAFEGNNINRMKSGSVLSVPSVDSMRDIDATAARRTVVAQSVDFQKYREALAERMNIPAANAGNTAAAGNDTGAAAAGNRSSSGSVGVTVKEPGARPEPQDQLKLTAPGQAGSNAAGKTAANANAVNDSKTLDQIAADKALADANSRIAALEKNLSQMEQMLEVRDRKLADAQKAAELAAPAAVVSASASWTDYLNDPIARAIAGGAGMLALLALMVGLRLRARRSGSGKSGQRGKRSKVNLVGAVTPDQKPEGKAAGKAAAGDVDAIAEADVYIAYGRDEQAEEILRDALRTQPQRHALRMKLLEIYAARHDRKAFSELATELCALTGGKGSAWEQAAQMGQMLDPGNPLYGSLPQAMDAIAQRNAPAPAPLQAVPSAGKDGGRGSTGNPAGTSAGTSAGSPVDDFGLKLEGLLDEQRREQGRSPAPMQTPAASAAASATPDFSLSGIGRSETGGRRIEPTLSGEPDHAALTTKLDLAQACQEIGDEEGARELLAEVAAARDPELSLRAQDLLRKLA